MKRHDLPLSTTSQTSTFTISSVAKMGKTRRLVSNMTFDQQGSSLFQASAQATLNDPGPSSADMLPISCRCP